MWEATLGNPKGLRLVPYTSPALFSMTIGFVGVWLFSVLDRSARRKGTRRFQGPADPARKPVWARRCIGSLRPTALYQNRHCPVFSDPVSRRLHLLPRNCGRCSLVIPKLP